MNFAQEYIVITGASGKIGKSLANEFAKKGANLILLDHPNASKSNSDLAQYLDNKYNGDTLSYNLDITNSQEIKECFYHLQSKIPRIDVLINNAGINAFLPAVQITEEVWDQIIDVNLKGAFFVSQQVSSWMISQKKGVIINIASQHGIVGNSNRAPYCASKAGLINLSRALSYEWAKYQIRVNTISPTFVHDINDELNHNHLNSSQSKREFLSKIPLRKYATPIDVANAAVYLSSNMAQMITGHNLVVDGGWTAI